MTTLLLPWCWARLQHWCHTPLATRKNSESSHSRNDRPNFTGLKGFSNFTMRSAQCTLHCGQSSETSKPIFYIFTTCRVCTPLYIQNFTIKNIWLARSSNNAECQLQYPTVVLVKMQDYVSSDKKSDWEHFSLVIPIPMNSECLARCFLQKLIKKDCTQKALSLATVYDTLDNCSSY